MSSLTREDALDLLCELQDEDEAFEIDGLIHLAENWHESLDAAALHDLIEHKGHVLRYEPATGDLYHFTDERIYEPMGAVALRNFLIRLLRDLNAEQRRLRAKSSDLSKDARVAIKAAVPSTFELTGRFVDGLAGALPPLFAPPPARCDTFVNFANGYIDLRELKQTDDLNDLTVFEPSEDVFLTMRLPFEFNPSATCPRWEQFLAEAIPSSEVQAFLQEFVGHLFVPTTRFEAALILQGLPGSGKGTTVSTICGLLGESNISDLSLDDLGDRFKPALLKNKLVNICNEVDPRKAIKEDVFKKIVSGEAVVVEEKHKPAYRLTPFARWIITANEFPRVADNTGAFFRRCYVLHFDAKFTDITPPPAGYKLKDPGLKDRLLTELPGICLWALTGLARLVRRKRFDPPEEVFANRREFQSHTNPVAQFISEKCEINFDDGGLTATTAELYAAFQEWCRRTNRDLNPNTINVFGKRLVAELASAANVTEEDVRNRAKARATDKAGKDRGFAGVALRNAPVPIPRAAMRRRAR